MPDAKDPALQYLLTKLEMAELSVALDATEQEYVGRVADGLVDEIRHAQRVFRNLVPGHALTQEDCARLEQMTADMTEIIRTDTQERSNNSSTFMEGSEAAQLAVDAWRKTLRRIYRQAGL